ncbi:hypothetical protein [Streptomyces albipurpureus]|uniref:Uncharacterized protein n=1 Tax=Streptomyces albipurpureus TaxID=2897419 RepID=A0ABT0UIR6_9ACTN|nr:hypothetical protein [Streptomyces sp. CWNU-1]MCM2388127.1 hypothetical protein [Streptomyces sp. CWNU-1]
MDPLVLTAGSALVAAIATDGWLQVRSSAVELWRRVHPERVPAVEAELAEVRDEVLAARESGELDAIEGLEQDWQRRLQRLLRDDPALAVELRRILDEQWLPATSPSPAPQVHSVRQDARAVGPGSRIYQAGNDLTVTD